MKKNLNYILAGCLGIVLMTSCNSDQLDTSPTTSVSGTTLFATPSAAMIPLNGIYRSMYTAGWSTTGNTHQCFGISAYNLMADVMGDDCIMASQGSGWFWYDCIYNVKSLYTRTTWRPYDLWNAYYTWISNANYILANDSTMTGTEADKDFVMGQAYAIRAYSYFMLAQSFARTYKGHESEPCVPIYTAPTKSSTLGKARSTVQQVYTQIVSDITKSVTYLKVGAATSLGTNKSYITYPVALGIQSRIALVMEDWQTAATAAETAITASGCSIQSIDATAFVENGDNFINDVTQKNIMWGSAIVTDQAGQYASLFAHMDAEAGYYGKTARKQINIALYNSMSQTDSRRVWWNPADANNGSGGYQQEKFKFRALTTWLGDYVWMRVEEMYLNAAEAECMLGHEDNAKTYLLALMAKRDANYKCTKTGTSMGTLTSDETGSLREEIVKQRRLELWGEFGRIYDIRRLKQGFRRTTAMGWPSAALMNTRNSNDPESYMWVITIPQTEFDGNASLNEKTDQNPVGDSK